MAHDTELCSTLLVDKSGGHFARILAMSSLLPLYLHRYLKFLIEKAENLPTSMLSSRFLVVHDAVRRGQHKIPELTRWQQICYPLLNFVHTNIETRRNYAALVETTDQINYNFASPVIVDVLKITNVTLTEATRGRRCRSARNATRLLATIISAASGN